MDYAITFLEGVITFISPCLLPLLPVYVAFFAGGVENPGRDNTARPANHAGETGCNVEGGVTDEGDGTRSSLERDGKTDGSMRRTVTCALGFIAGFTLLFTLLGAFAGTIGSLVIQYQTALNVVCGLIVIILGLNYLGIAKIPLLERTLKPNTSVTPRGFFSSLVFGMVFALGWTPCVGAFLGSALSLAATSGQTATGITLLACYSLGLGVPFFIAAILIDQLEGAFSWVKAHYRIVNGCCGALLVVVGTLMATGLFGYWLRLLSF